MKKHTLLTFALAVLLSGCGALHKPVPPLSPDQEAELAKHVISIDRDGKLKHCNENSEYTTKYIACQQKYFQEITDGIKDFKKKRSEKETEVLLFVHGGLNKPDESMERALKKYHFIEDKWIYPIFVIWDSRGPSSYKEHLWSIRHGEKDGLAKYTSPIYLLTDIGNSIVNAPKAWFVTGDHLFDSTNQNIKEKSKEIVKEIDEIKEKEPLLNIVYHPTDEDKKHDSRVQQWLGNPNKSSRSFYWLFTSPAKVVTAPFAYTMAKPAWDIMLRRTDTLFYTPCDLDGDRYADCKKNSEKTSQIPKWGAVGNSAIESKLGSGALSVFLQHLEREPDMRITLIGHSMGAIVVNKIILMKPNLPYKNIVHLASADSVNHVLDIIIPYLNYALQKRQGKFKDVQFYSLMLHPDNEDRESAYKGLVPSGSLLTWIDEMYTTPETVMNRRSGRWDNIRKTMPLIPNTVAGNMHFKIFGTDSKQDKKKEECKDKEDCPCPVTVPQKHGDFDDMCFWDEAKWK